MTENEYLLTVLSEECAEVTHRVSKMLRFGPTQIEPGQELNNKERLTQELTDLIAVGDILYDRHLVGAVFNSEKQEKYKKVKKFMDLSRKLGTLTG